MNEHPHRPQSRYPAGSGAPRAPQNLTPQQMAQLQRRREKRRKQIIRNRIIFAVIGVILLAATITLLTLAVKGIAALFGSRSAPDASSLPPVSSASVIDSSAAPSEPDARGEAPWNLILANRENPLPDDFAPPELATPNGTTKQVDSRITDDLNRMVADCNAAGNYLYVSSAYRDKAYQQALFNQQLSKYSGEDAYEEAAKWVAIPGTSEHQTGLAVDFGANTALGQAQHLEHGWDATPEYAWLTQHCTEYGFVLRYPEDKQEVTGITYEPWHYRYVGVEAAQEMQRLGLCLEEYLAQFYD